MVHSLWLRRHSGELSLHGGYNKMLNIITRYRAKELNFQFQDKNLCSPAMIKSLKFKSGALKAILTLKRAGFPIHTYKENAVLALLSESGEAHIILGKNTCLFQLRCCGVCSVFSVHLFYCSSHYLGYN